ncbi:MAG TPA: hypothetical protein VEP89_05660 [Draconibacterium sp.]|nr:hypothetical protein [Draconibacterium sp.]
MKKISVIVMLALLCTTISFAQRTYSEENLKRLSTQEIDLLLKNAKVNKTIGIVMSITGPVMAVYPLTLGDNMSLDTIGTLFLIGSIFTLIGLPVFIVNSSRVKKIRNALKDNVSVEIAPTMFHNYGTQVDQAGFTIRFRF